METLLLDPDRLSAATLRVPDHPGLSLCSGEVPDVEVRADLSLVAAATVTGADVAVAGAGVLRGTPVAALLRWDDNGQAST